MVSIDISNPSTVTVKSRIPNVFEDIDQENSFPIQAANGDYFECYEANKGAITGWKKVTLNNPKCRAIN
jgi:hypothetical protein